MEYRGKVETIEFWKMNGSGNDFILIDNMNGLIKDEELSQFVERVCRRRESVGADGVLLVTRSDRYDFGWRFLNADGGEVEMWVWIGINHNKNTIFNQKNICTRI